MIANCRNITVGIAISIAAFGVATPGSAKDNKSAASDKGNPTVTSVELGKYLRDAGITADRRAKVSCGKFTGNDRSTGWESPAFYRVWEDLSVISFRREMDPNVWEYWQGLKTPSGKIMLVGNGRFWKGSADKWNMEFSGDFQKDKTVLKGRYTNYIGTTGYRECEIQFLD